MVDSIFGEAFNNLYSALVSIMKSDHEVELMHSLSFGFGNIVKLESRMLTIP